MGLSTPAMALAACLAAAAPALAQAPVQSSGAPLSPLDPIAAGPDAAIAAAAAAAATPPQAYARRDGVSCPDFKRADGGGWTVQSAVQLPGPQGPVKLSAGQAVGPGDYVGGLDLAAILQRDCP